MSSSVNGQWPSRRKSVTATAINKDEGSDLTESLSQLSLNNDPATLRPARRASVTSSSQLNTSFRRSSSTSLDLPRSPSTGLVSRRGSHVEAPALIRKASINSLHSANGSGLTRSLSIRASSAQNAPSAQHTSPISKLDPGDEKPPVTAKSLARDYFRAELQTHHDAATALPTDTIVVLNDAVYGHRFSRPRASRSALSTIVERPERIKATVLGVSLAYVRLGGRHCQGGLPISPKRSICDIDSIPFRIQKTTRRLSLLSAAVTNVHGTKWMEELKLMCESAESVLAMGGKELQRPNVARGSDQPAPEKLHEGDLYLCAESQEAIEGALGAVCEAVDIVFGDGPRRAFVGVRPPGHHCSASYPSGFCWINNVHVGIMHGILSHGLTHAAIVDFDLHHGDGSQAITWQHNSRATLASKAQASWKKSSIGYFSLHDINSYPCEMGDEDKVKNASLCIDDAHGQTIWNVHLQSWKTEKEFWALYEKTYSVLLERMRNYLTKQAQKLREAKQQPKAAIFFSAGFDASEWESAGMQRHQVNVPTEFYARLSQDVVRIAREEGLGVDGRVISVLEGGYSDRALFSGVFSHLSGLAGGKRPIKTEQKSDNATWENSQNLNTIIPDPQFESNNDGNALGSYDASWWSSAQLDQLEQPLEQPSTPRKPRSATPTNFSSPTQASTARVLDPVKMRQSLSSIPMAYAKFAPRPPSPPPPEVSWVVAAKELCDVLIPSERQTSSCKPEDLNAEASRARRDRQSILLGYPVPTPTRSEKPPARKSLRERKSRAVGSIDEEAGELLPRTRRKQMGTPVASPVKLSRGAAQPSGTQSAAKLSYGPRDASAPLSPHTEEPPSIPPVPATAPVPRRSTTSRPNSRTGGRAQGGDKVSVHKNGAATARKDPEVKGSRAGAPKIAGTPARTTKYSNPVVETPTPSTGLLPSDPGDDLKDDLDRLTNGVKKIRINLITQSQKDARLKAKEQESRAAGSVEDASASVQSTESSTPADVPSVPSVSEGSPAPSAKPAKSGSSSPTPAVSLPAASSPGGPQVNVQAASAAEDLFIQYQPEGPEPVSVPQPEPLKWLPPNVPTPSATTPAVTPSPPKQRQSGLFVYQSGIPFAPRPGKSPRDAPSDAKQHLDGNESKSGQEPSTHG